MKIFIVAPLFYPKVSGGGEITLLELAESLNMDFDIVTSKGHKAKEWNGHRIHSVLPFNTKRIVNRLFEPLIYTKSKPILKELIRQEKAELLLSINSAYHWPISDLNIPKIAWVNCWKETCLTHLQSCLDPCGYYESFKCLLNSRGYRKIGLLYHPLLYWIQKKKIDTLRKFDEVLAPNSNIGFYLFKNQVHYSRINQPINTKRWIRHDVDKNIDVMFPAVKDDRKGGPIKHALIKELQKNNLNYAFVTGFDFQDMPLQYSMAKVACCPYGWNEPIGRIPFEGMSCETPVVVTRRGGLIENYDVQSPFLCDYNPVSIVKQIKWALAHDPIIRGKDMRQYIVKNHDAKKVANDLKTKIKEVVQWNTENLSRYTREQKKK